MRALLISAALVSTALSGCVRCCIPLNAPPYDPAQWGWGPQDRFCVTRSYYGFAKDYPGVHPYRMVPPGAPPYQPGCVRACPACGPSVGPWPAQIPMAGPNVVGPNAVAPNAVAPNAMVPNVVVGPSVAGGPTAVAF
jgi:hypothetical protein